MSREIKISITSWLNGSVLFEYEAEDNTVKKTVEEAVRQRADLRGADLWKANLRGANLQGANLQRANLQEANLWRANLQEANLQEANLWRANLRGADLWEANLREANLQGANLREAKNINGDSTDFWWHVHHEVLVEQLTEPVRARINYILKEKPKEEQELRLKLLKPVLGKIPTTDKGWERLHKKECKNCPWDGKSIFSKLK